MPITVEQLKQNWSRMHPVDRARATAKIKRSGTSIRQIAKQVGCSASLLGHLLAAFQAPAADILLARKGEITFNELVRRARSEKAKREISRRDIEQQKRSKKALKGATIICKWLVQTGLAGPSCETIIENVRRELAEREQQSALPPERATHLSTDEIIRRMKPPELKPDDDLSIDGWFQTWLCRWVFWAFPDSGIRSAALDVALERQWKR